MSIRFRDKTNHRDITLGGIPYLFSRLRAGLTPQAPSGSGTTKYLREDGTWEVPPDTNNKVAQTISTGNSDYRVLFSSTADNTTRTEGARKDGDFTYNPSTNNLSVEKINGNDVSTAGILSLLHPVGTIIESTTCDTMAKVVEAYGGTTWIQHTGYVLRGASSGVTANSATKTGGSDTHTLTGAESGLKGHGHGFTQPTVNGGATNTGGMSANNPHYHSFGYYVGSSGSGYGIVDSATARSSGIPNTANTNIAHTHTQVAHTHSVSGGKVTDASAANATSAHNNLPNYKSVYIWERTA